MKALWIFALVLLMLPFAYAEECKYNEDVLSSMDGANIADNGLAKRLFGKDTGIKLIISDEQKEYYFSITNYTVSYKGTEVVETIGFIVTTDACTLQRIDQGGDVFKEYQDKNIVVKGNTGGKKTKMFFGKIGFWFYNVFS
ncbi:MAG: hypothetical protein WC758_06710 [Candidatus Woesearchaeota archaeon]|jgi:hypothetical protein